MLNVEKFKEFKENYIKELSKIQSEFSKEFYKLLVSELPENTTLHTGMGTFILNYNDIKGENLLGSHLPDFDHDDGFDYWAIVRVNSKEDHVELHYLLSELMCNGVDSWGVDSSLDIPYIIKKG